MRLSKLFRLLFAPTPEEQGERGEDKVSATLKRFDPIGKDGHILRNLYVPVAKDNTREIDLLCVTAKGLIVVESKDYAGYIFGDEARQNWTVTLNGGRRGIEKHHFFNPIWQNNAHIMRLRNTLDMIFRCFQSSYSQIEVR